MPAADDIFVKIGGSAQDLIVAINAGLGSLQKLRNSVGSLALNSAKSFNALTSSVFSLQNILAGSAVSAVAGWSIKLAAEAEQSQIAFGVMLGSGKAAKEMLAELKAYANVSPFSQRDVREGAQLLLNYGVEANKIVSLMKRLGDVAGGDAQKLNGLSRAFAQVNAMGRLQGQDLNQLINAGWNPLTNITQKTGESMAMVKARMEQGEVSFREVEQALKDATSEGGRFFGMTEQQSQSTAGLFSSAMDIMESSATEFGKVLLKSLNVNDALSNFNENFGSIPDRIAESQPIVDMFRDKFVGAFKDLNSSLGQFKGEGEEAIGVFSFGADVVAAFGKIGFAAFHGIQYVAGGVLGIMAQMAKAWAFLTTDFGKKPDYSFADALMEERNKMVDAAGKGFSDVLNTALPSQDIKTKLSEMKDARTKMAAMGKDKVEAPDVEQPDDTKRTKAQEKTDDKAAKMILALKAEIDAFDEGSHAKERFKLAQEGVDEKTLDYIDTLREQIDMQKKAKEESKKWADIQKKLIEDSKMPTDKYKEQFEQAKKLFEMGKITDQQFTAIGKHLDKESAKENPQNKKQFAAAELANSQQARESILAFYNPTKKSDYAKQTLDINKKQLVELQKLNRSAPPEDYDQV